MKTNIEQSANTASVVRGRMCEVLTCGAYIEQGSVVKMTTVTTGGYRNEFHPEFRSGLFKFFPSKDRGTLTYCQLGH